MSARATPFDESVTKLTAPLDVLAEEFGAVAGQMKRESRLRIDAAIADLQRRDAERELRFSNLERQIADRLASLKDGEPGKSVSIGDVAPVLVAELDRRFAELPKPKDGENGKDADPKAVADLVAARVTEAVAAIPPAKDGKDADPVAIAEMVSRAVAAMPPAEPGPPGKDAEPPSDELIAAAISRHLAANPPAPGKDAPPVETSQIAEAAAAYLKANPPAAGKDVDPAVVASLVETAVREAVAAIPAPEKGERGAPGALPTVQSWEDRVHYEGNVVAHAGATYQASRDTAKEPPHADWVCLAAAGKDGAEGRSFAIRGTFDAAAAYLRLDVVAVNGASFAAKRDNPGACPGDGWQLIAKQGGPGKPGDPGRAGIVARGTKAEALTIDEDGLLTLRNEDGSTVTCDLYPLLAKIA